MHAKIDYWIKNNGEEGPLPGLAFTSRQLFWMGFARRWCAKDIHEDSDEHSPGMYRIIGTLQNSEYFAIDFGCKPGSRMNPDNKCNMW